MGVLEPRLIALCPGCQKFGDEFRRWAKLFENLKSDDKELAKMIDNIDIKRLTFAPVPI
jgi:hypothetical protein